MFKQAFIVAFLLSIACFLVHILGATLLCLALCRRILYTNTYARAQMQTNTLNSRSCFCHSLKRDGTLMTSKSPVIGDESLTIPSFFPFASILPLLEMICSLSDSRWRLIIDMTDRLYRISSSYTANLFM